MFPRRFVVLAVAVLVIVGLFSAMLGAQQQAWEQGYLVGRLSAGTGTGSAAPIPPTFYPGYGAYGRHGGPFGFIIPLLFFGLLFFGLSRLFRFWMWNQHGYGPRGYFGGQAPWSGGQPQQQPGSQQGSGQGQPGQQGNSGPQWHQHPWWGWHQPPQGQPWGTPQTQPSQPQGGQPPADRPEGQGPQPTGNPYV